jgi:hypothetical protein
MTETTKAVSFRFTIKHSVLLMIVMGLVSLLFAYVLPVTSTVAPK